MKSEAAGEDQSRPDEAPPSPPAPLRIPGGEEEPGEHSSNRRPSHRQRRHAVPGEEQREHRNRGGDPDTGGVELEHRGNDPDGKEEERRLRSRRQSQEPVPQARLQEPNLSTRNGDFRTIRVRFDPGRFDRDHLVAAPDLHTVESHDQLAHARHHDIDETGHLASDGHRLRTELRLRGRDRVGIPMSRPQLRRSDPVPDRRRIEVPEPGSRSGRTEIGDVQQPRHAPVGHRGPVANPDDHGCRRLGHGLVERRRITGRDTRRVDLKDEHVGILGTNGVGEEVEEALIERVLDVDDHDGCVVRGRHRGGGYRPGGDGHQQNGEDPSRHGRRCYGRTEDKDRLGYPLVMPRVLVVSDEPWVRNEVHAALSEPGVELIDHQDPETVAATVATDDVDVVLVDLQVGSMGGMAITRSMKDSQPDGRAVPVIMLLDRPVDSFLAGRAGAEAWVTKPFGAPELRRAVQAVTVPDQE